MITEKQIDKIAQKYLGISSLSLDAKWPAGCISRCFGDELVKALKAAYRLGQRNPKQNKS